MAKGTLMQHSIETGLGSIFVANVIVCAEHNKSFTTNQNKKIRLVSGKTNTAKSSGPRVQSLCLFYFFILILSISVFTHAKGA
jgi:hypothetical protein